MRPLVLPLLLAVWLAGTAWPSFAQSPELMALYREHEALMKQGRYREAEAAIRQAIERAEAEYERYDPDLGRLLSHLSAVLNEQGRYAEAGEILDRILTIYKIAFGDEHPEIGAILNNKADLAASLGRYDESIALHKRGLAMIERSLGPDHPNVAKSLSNMANTYLAQGRLDEAELLYQRALRIDEAAFGPESPQVAGTLDSLSTLYRFQGRYEEAEALFDQVIAIREEVLGSEHPVFAATLANLAELYRFQGRYEEALPLQARALQIREKVFGLEHPNSARSIASLGLLLTELGRYEEAAEFFGEDVRITESLFGPKHPELAIALNNAASLFETIGAFDLALPDIRRASAIYRERLSGAAGGQSAGGFEEQRSVRYIFLRHLFVAVRAAKDDPTLEPELTAESFEVGQLANATLASAAITRMAARFAARDDELAGLIRQRQDGTDRWRRLEEALAGATSRPPDERNQAAEAAIRSEQEELEEWIAAIDAWLEASFPEFADLTSTRPLPLDDAQALLADDEALLAYLVWNHQSFVFVLRRDRAAVLELELGEEDLNEAVTQLRRSLDPSGVRRLEDLPTFDAETAHRLYQALFEPIEAFLDGAKHVFVVPDGALQSLPLGVLVTEPVSGAVEDFAALRSLPWLADRYAMSTLPSVSSLNALRAVTRESRASRPFLGVGDPRLAGETGSSRGLSLASLFTARGIADVESVRQLPSLPDTAEELRSIAGSLGVGDEALILGSEATETRLKALPLKTHKVLAFATHGLVAGELTGLSEPALVLTPPDEGSDRDDGLLTASEVAQLDLDADWVILSACNTAAADGTPGAEGLSGLAKAFFHAGSRALLVSHWPIASQAAVEITTRMLAEAAKPDVGRAEAHRRAMRSLIEDEARPYFSHPLFWAPFTVVGEGGLGRGASSP